jgi:purine-binding chemotaxis protein CheW
MTTDIEKTASNLAAKPGKYLTFLLGRECYGLPVLRVREIIRPVEITPVPQMPAYVKGVINLRGKLVPVMDLRMRFDIAAQGTPESICFVVAQVKCASGSPMHMGFIVDGVEEVLVLAGTEIEKTPDFGTRLSTEYLLGMANINGKVVALLDIDRVLDRDSIQTISQATGKL